MIHRKRRMPASVFQGATACILIGAVAIAPAQAQTFNLAEFVKSYEDQTGGRVYEIEREIASGRAVYDIESSRGEEIYELQIDMVTGELVSEKVEDASWRLISKRKKTALWNAPHSLGDILIANPNFSGDVIVDEISSRVRDGSVIYTVDVRGSGKLVLDATDVEVVPVLTNVAHNGDTADREFMRDIRPEHWFWNGMDPLIVDQILARIKSADAPRERPEYHDGITKFGPGEWTFEFETTGDDMMARGAYQEQIGSSHVAAAYYKSAAAYYAAAKFPHYVENQYQDHAFAKNIDALESSWRVRGMTFERVSSTFEGQPVDGILMVPEGTTEPVPIVLATNGIDVLKGEFFHLPEMLMEKDIAFFAFDMVGTGSHSHIDLTPDSQRVTEHFMAELGADPRFDASRIGLMGVSFGGNAVVKLAMEQPAGLKAVVNMCGPVHATFMLDEAQAASIEPMYLEAFADRIGADVNNISEIVRRAQGFSLVDQGLLGNGKVTDVPIFTVNAEDDYVAPVSDMELVNASTTDGRLLFSGAGDHCPQDRFLVMGEVADWLEARL